MSTPFLSFNPGDIIEDSHVEQFIEPIQNLETGRTWYAEATGSVNAFEVDLVPAPLAYTGGLLVHFKSDHTVTGPATINVNGLGTKALLKGGSTSLASGDIVSGQLISAIYDGNEFQLLSPVLNPTVAPIPKVENVLVYSEPTKENATTTVTTLGLPSFTFDVAKSYLMEIAISATSTGQVRVNLSDGTSNYAFPESPELLAARANFEDAIVYKKLPNLSGTHTISVDASFVSTVQVRFFEIHDNLVYADFRPRNTSTTVTTVQLEDFQAVTGHRYLLVANLSPSGGNKPTFGCYLTDGVEVDGLPASDPLSDTVGGPNSNGDWEVARILSDLDGTFQVFTRASRIACAGVRIFDIT